MSTTTAVKERPVLFSGPMVRAILDGSKTQTRRVFKIPRGMEWYDGQCGLGGEEKGYLCDIEGNGWWHVEEIACPYGDVGDRLWVREAFYADTRDPMDGRNPAIIYAATPELAKEKLRPDVIRCTFLDQKPVARHEAIANLKGHKFQRLRPSIHMPRWASRITLEVTGVRVERLQSITDADAIAEGIESKGVGADGRPRWNVYGLESLGQVTSNSVWSYERLWGQIHGPDAWASNPWVWVVTFKRLETGGPPP